jgi:hypothetical protein
MAEGVEYPTTSDADSKDEPTNDALTALQEAQARLEESKAK